MAKDLSAALSATNVAIDCRQCVSTCAGACPPPALQLLGPRRRSRSHSQPSLHFHMATPMRRVSAEKLRQRRDNSLIINETTCRIICSMRVRSRGCAMTLRLIVERKIYFKTRGCGLMTDVDAGTYDDVRRQQQFAGPRPRLARSKSYNFQASTGPCLQSDSVTGDDVICWCPPLGVRANR